MENNIKYDDGNQPIIKDSHTKDITLSVTYTLIIVIAMWALSFIIK